MVSGGLAPVVVGFLTRLLLDTLVHPPGTGPGPAVLGAGIVLGAATVLLVPAASGFVFGALRRGSELALQGDLFRALNRLPGITVFQSPKTLDEVNVAQTSGVAAPANALLAVSGLCQGGVTLAGFVVALWAIRPLYAGLMVLAALPDLLSQLTLSNQRVRVQGQVAHHNRRRLFFMMLHLEEPAAREIRLYRFGDYVHGRMQRELAEMNQVEASLARRELRREVVASIASTLASGLGLLMIIAATVRGAETIGDVALYLAAVVGVQGAMGSGVQAIGQLTEAVGAYAYFESVVSTPADLTVSLLPKAIAPLRESLTLKDVWFRYAPQGPWVLEGVNIKFPANTTSALVGVNGSGKSTLVKLLCRLYDPERGSILWDGVDVREFDIEALRARLGVMFQDFMCYDLTLAENIVMGDRRTADRDRRLFEAADVAGVRSVADRLPHGFETMLGRAFEADDGPWSGARLSGGEWQKVAVARALAKCGADLLVLDEPTAGLDAAAERELLGHLGTMEASKTVILVSHRLDCVRLAANIVMLSEGRVAEQGTHTQLIIKDGLYKDLFQHRRREPAN